MINNLRSLAQLGLTHEIIPQCRFQGWLSKVLRVESVTLADNEDFDFVSDVLDHQFVANNAPAQATPTRRNCGPSGGGNGHPLESYHTPTRGDEHQHPSRKDKK